MRADGGWDQAGHGGGNEVVFEGRWIGFPLGLDGGERGLVKEKSQGCIYGFGLEQLRRVAFD